MKLQTQLFLRFACLAAACLALAVPVTQAAELTAFQLIPEANRHVGEDAKGRVVQIRSDKSVGSLTPNVWYIVLYDPDASAKATEVKIAGGKKVDVKRPARILELLSRSTGELPMDELKIDSDRAIEIATSEPILKNLTLTATRLELVRWEGTPIWKVRLWAERVRQPTREADLGEIFIAATDGRVLRNRLEPRKAG